MNYETLAQIVSHNFYNLSYIYQNFPSVMKISIQGRQSRYVI